MYFHLIPEFLDFFRTVSTVEADYGNADENTHFLELWINYFDNEFLGKN